MGERKKKKAKEICLLLPTGRLMPSQYPNNSHPGSWLPPPFLFPLPQVLLLITALHGMEHPVASMGKLFWQCPLLTSCLSLAYLHPYSLGGTEWRWEKGKILMFFKPVQQQPKCWCVSSTVLARKLKHGTIPAAKS